MYAGFADAERAHLDDLTLVATEALAEADLVLGHHGGLVSELEALCREHPLLVRLWELLMLALYRAGRQAEVLWAYSQARDYPEYTRPPSFRPGRDRRPGWRCPTGWRCRNTSTAR